MNSNFDIEAAANDEDDDYVQQFSTRLKSMMIFLVILICVVTPYALNFEYSRAENSEQNLEDFLKVVDQDVLGKTILGATLEERVGHLEVPKDCAIFYADDPDINPFALATKICPNEADNHISFHIKGVFGTHPNNTFLDDAEKGAKVKFVATGTNVWATFFDQHNSTMQSYTVAPGNSIDIATLAGDQAATFYNDFDAVKVLNSPTSIAFKIKGMQPQYPECATFYESQIVDVSTDGFMVCHNFRSKYVQLKGSTLEAVTLDYITSRTRSIAFVVVGEKVSVFLDFEKNNDMKNVNLEEGSIRDLIDEIGRKSKSMDASLRPDLRPKLVKLIAKDFKKARKSSYSKGPVKPPPTMQLKGDKLIEVTPALATLVETSEEQEEEQEEQIEAEEEQTTKSTPYNLKGKHEAEDKDDD